MDKKNFIIIVLAIVVIALIAAIGFVFLNNSQDNVVIFNNSIEGVGTFNTTNVTNFTLNNSSNDHQTNYVANDTIAQITTTSVSSLIEVSISEADRVNDSAKGHTIYKNTATIGDHKGEVRFFSVLKDEENQRYVFISTADYNLTCMIVDSFKFY